MDAETSDVIMNERLHTYTRRCLRALAKGEGQSSGEGFLGKRDRMNEEFWVRAK